jgi:hypothetical protein
VVFAIAQVNLIEFVILRLLHAHVHIEVPVSDSFSLKYSFTGVNLQIPLSYTKADSLGLIWRKRSASQFIYRLWLRVDRRSNTLPMKVQNFQA